MNDLMMKSFLSYVDMKKEAQIDADAHRLHEKESNLSHFFQEVNVIQSDMEDISSLLVDLQNLNEEAKNTHSAKILHCVRNRMNSNMVSVLRKCRVVKGRLDLRSKF